MLTEHQRDDMRKGIPAIGLATAREWIKELLDHADEMDDKLNEILTKIALYNAAQGLSKFTSSITEIMKKK